MGSENGYEALGAALTSKMQSLGCDLGSYVDDDEHGEWSRGVAELRADAATLDLSGLGCHRYAVTLGLEDVVLLAGAIRAFMGDLMRLDLSECEMPAGGMAILRDAVKGRDGFEFVLPNDIMRRSTGVAVSWSDRGFGFIKPDDGTADLFSSAITDGKALQKGKRVEFVEPYDLCRGKYQAIEVSGGIIQDCAGSSDGDGNRYNGGRDRYGSNERYRGVYSDRYTGRRGRYDSDDRYRGGGNDRYNGGRDRYGCDDRYRGCGRDRYNGGRDRYFSDDRYRDGYSDRYNGGCDRYFSDDRYRGGYSDRYSGGRDRYNGGRDRYGSDDRDRGGYSDRYNGGRDSYGSDDR